MPSDSDYSDLVSQAERAVAGVKDPELKRAAFEKVLSDLLARRETSSPQSPPGTKKPRKSPVNRGRGPKTYLIELIEEGFFKKPKTIAQVKAELENRGHHIPLTSLSGPLQRLCQARTLRRQRTKSEAGKTTFNYSDW